MNEVQIQRWETKLSKCKRLYFVEFVHRSILRFTVEDEGKNKFLVEINSPGPYRIYDEQYLVDYWSIDEDRGWSFIVKNAEWDYIHPQLLENYQPNTKHYVIATLDYCLEVLTHIEPTVKMI